MPGGGEGGAAAPAGRAGAVAVRPGAGAAAAAAARELAEARRRLLEAEGRRRLVAELERRVEQLHRVFLEAELRLAVRAESLGRLGAGAAQAELFGQRLRRGLRRPGRGLRAPALLASALRLGCVPCAARPRRAPEPDSPRRRRPRSPAASARLEQRLPGGDGAPAC